MKVENLRRYTPELLAVLPLRATTAAQGVLHAVDTLRDMNAEGSRKLPANAPTTFIKPRWRPLVFTEHGLDRRFYEICALSELKNALRSGDIWVQGSRQFKDFEEYLLPADVSEHCRPRIPCRSPSIRRVMPTCRSGWRDWRVSWPP